MNKVESVQHRFTKHFVCCYGLTYSQRLTKLRIETLELHRLYLDLVYVYKILFGMVETEVSTNLVLHKEKSVTVQTHKIAKKQTVNNISTLFLSASVDNNNNIIIIV